MLAMVEEERRTDLVDEDARARGGVYGGVAARVVPMPVGVDDRLDGGQLGAARLEGGLDRAIGCCAPPVSISVGHGAST